MSVKAGTKTNIYVDIVNALPEELSDPIFREAHASILAPSLALIELRRQPRPLYGYMGKIFYTYSFALYPEDHKPSGTVNMSRLDHASCTFTNNAHNQAPSSYKLRGFHNRKHFGHGR